MKEHLVPCAFGCGRMVDATDPWTWHRVVGLERRGQGGGSDVILRQRKEEYFCLSCVEKAKAGVTVGQERLV